MPTHRRTTHTAQKKGLYPYTLKPIALNLTDQEFQNAQLALFKQSTQPQTLRSLTPKEWVILALITGAAIIGLILVSGYSTVLFWLMLIGVGIYLLLRTLGMNWYIKQEYQKQVAATAMPKELDGMAVSVQPHGLILTLPSQKNATQQALIRWEQVTAWEETADFLFIMFCVDNQNGSQIIPKRLANNKLPLDTIKDHLSTTPKGLPRQM